MPAAAALAFAAAAMMDERDAASVRRLRHDLVSEHDAGELGPQLLDIRSAEPAREHAHELAVAARLVDLADDRLPRRVE